MYVPCVKFTTVVFLQAAQMDDKMSGLMSVVGDLESSVGQLNDECRQYREHLHSLKHTHSKEVERLQEILADKQLEVNIHM